MNDASLQHALCAAAKLPAPAARRVVRQLALHARQSMPAPPEKDWMEEAERLFEAAMGQAVIDAMTETFSMMREES